MDSMDQIYAKCNSKSLYPESWKFLPHHAETRQILEISDPEYDSISLSLDEEAAGRVMKIERIVNFNQYSIFLARQQHLRYVNPDKTYYTVTKFCNIVNKSIDNALHYLVDRRRCTRGSFFKSITTCDTHSGSVIAVVELIVDDAKFSSTQLDLENDDDIYVKYLIFFK